jgi:hypothetical protein
MRQQSIIHYTEQVAGEIAARYAEDPATELDVWVRLAHQREAMVCQVYQLAAIEERLREEPQTGIDGLIRSALVSIAAHEEKHTRFLSSVRQAAGSAAALAEVQGCIEGWITRQAASGDRLARMAIAIAAALTSLPDFARDLKGMDLRELLAFSTELETTARMGYQRILQLASRVEAEAAGASGFGLTFRHDVVYIGQEERFHEAALLEMSNWLRDADDPAAARSVQSCARALHRLCDEHLSAGAVRGAASETPGLEACVPRQVADDEWVSAGGLESWFDAAGLAVPLTCGAA